MKCAFQTSRESGNRRPPCAEIIARSWACRTYHDFSNSAGLPRPPETQVYQDFASDEPVLELAVRQDGTLYPVPPQTLDHGASLARFIQKSSLPAPLAGGPDEK
jgi:hypothetical protein